MKYFLTILRRIFTAASAFVLLTAGVFTASAQSGKESIAYKLAILYTREGKPEDALLNKPAMPAAAVVSEFQWILDSLKIRCLNPETAIADTIVENWTAVNKNGGKPIGLLETARELATTTKNINLFGKGKVNFRMTSNYWLKQKLAGKK